MSTETPVAALTIPPASYAALHEAGDEPVREYVAAISAPVVAAELRRLADRYGARSATPRSGTHRPGFRAVSLELRDRADELDPPA